MANKISVLIDVAVDKGISSLKDFRKSIQDADGAGGKFKAGMSGAFGAVKQNAGAMALGAGAAIAGFAIKALGDFQTAALAAQDAGKKIGLGSEDASRWIAVGDDFGVSTDEITGGLGKIVTSIDSNKWAKYGIDTRDASGKARDANQIILDTFDVLSKETNLTEQARLAKELLGKSYGALAPMIGKTRKELEGYLGSVAAGQVITGDEAEKARDMALAQDALSDAFKEITLAVGGLVAELAPVIEFLADGVTEVAELVGKVTDVANEVVDGLGAAFGGSTLTMPADLLKRLGDASKEAGVQSKEMGEDLAVGARHLRELETAAGRTGSQIENLTDDIARLRGELDQEQAALDYKLAVEEFGTAMAEAKGDTDAQSQALIDVKGKMLDYLEAVKGVPPSKQTEIAALIDFGKLDEAERLLNALARTRTSTVLAGVGQFGGGGGKKGVPLADGGIVRARHGGVQATIGEGRYDEAVIPLPDGMSGLGGQVTVYLTANGVTDPRQLLDMINKEIRRNGGTQI